MDIPQKPGPPALTTGPAGLALIKRDETRQLQAYLDPAGVWTIGYGHTGPEVHQGMTITPDRAEELLLQDVELAARAVRRLVAVPLSQLQFDAMVSFTFNEGAGALAKSHLLLFLNQRHYAQAAAEFPRWNIGGGAVLLGLVRRRFAEGTLFLDGTS